jgi:hypothetical protein
MDYTSLITTVGDRLNRSDINDVIPGLIAHVEQEINTRLARDPVRPMIKTYRLSATTQNVELPADFIDAVELSASDGTSEWPVVRLAPALQFEQYANATAPRIEPDATKVQHYRILGDTLVLSKSPADPLTLTLDCYTKLEPLTDTNATNWLAMAHGDIYLFGTLAHAAFYVRDYEFYRENKQLFVDGLEMLVLAYPERKRDIGLRITDAPWSARCG